jgi:hypothetical protein
MTAFNIHLNGKKVCTAGVDGYGVLGAHVSSVRRKGVRGQLSLHVGGLRSETGEHVVWHEALRLKAGDEVRIEVVESERPDSPTLTKKPDATADERARKKYVRDMARQLGWKIIVPK